METSEQLGLCLASTRCPLMKRSNLARPFSLALSRSILMQQGYFRVFGTWKSLADFRAAPFYG